jgi:hypothetical protein
MREQDEEKHRRQQQEPAVNCGSRSAHDPSQSARNNPRLIFISKTRAQSSSAPGFADFVWV